MPKEDKDMLVVDIDRQPKVQEAKVDGAEKLNALSWLCHHAGQMAKGSAALLGLLAVGGLGYYFGRRQSASSSASSSSNALEVATDFSSALAIDATPTPISFIADAAASKPLDLVYAESAENEDTKINFGNEEESHKNQQEQSSVRVEMQNTATTDETKELVVNGTISDQLIQVGYPWSGSINMTGLFGERANLTGFSQIGNQPLPNWLYAVPQLIEHGVEGYYLFDVTVVDNLAYISALEGGYLEGGLQIIDISDSSRPQLIQPGMPELGAEGVTIICNLAYVATWNKGLQIIDISNSSDPFVIEPGVSGFYAHGVTVQGNLAYVAALDNQGLKIIDISNSSDPFEKSSVTGFNAGGVTVQGNLAYVAAGCQTLPCVEGEGGLKIIDVSDSAHPFEKSSVPGFDSQDVTVQGNFAYVAAGNNQGLKIIDVSNSSSPFEKSSVPGFSAYGVTVQVNFAYVAAGQGLKIIDISNSSSPFIIEPGVPEFYANGVTVQSNLAYVAAEEGLKIIDLSQWQLSGTPMQNKHTYQFIISSESLLRGDTTKTFTIRTDNLPYVVGAIPNQSLYPKNSLSLAVRLTKVFADEDKEDTLFLSVNSEPQQDWLSFVVKKPILIAKMTNFFAVDVDIHGNLAYVAGNGLKIIDVSNNSNPFVIEPGALEYFISAVSVQGNLAYVASPGQGLKIIDVSNSSDPFEKSNVRVINARDVFVQGNLAYVAVYDNNKGLQIIDVSNSSNPFLVGPGMPGFYASGVTVQGNLAYVAASKGLKIIDVSNSSDPYEKSNVTGFYANGITVQGSLAYVTADTYEGFKGLKIIDISDSANPKPMSDVPGFGANGVTVSGNLAYVAAGKRLKIIDISKPEKPIIVSEVSGHAYGSAVLPANKVCVVGDSFSILDFTNYQFSGTPTEKDAGNYDIQVTATDPDGAQAQTSFTIRVEGGPRLSPNVKLPPRIALVGQPANFFVEQGTFEDPNNDVITYTAKLANEQKLPSFLSFNPSSATFFGIPAKSDKKNYLVTILASDRIVEPPTAENFVLAVQDPIPEQTFIVGRNDVKILEQQIPPDMVFEGRSLVYSIKPRSNETWPNWLYFDAPSRKLFGTPTATDVGTTSMQVTLNDGYGEAFVLFNLKVKFNSPPVLMSMIPTQYAYAEKHCEFAFDKDTFADAEDDELRYSADPGDARWLDFDADNRKFTGTPSGWTDTYPYSIRKYTITITAIDLSNVNATATFELNLHGPSSWQTFLTAGMVILGTLVSAYGYRQKKHLLWDFFKKEKYVKPLELLVIGDTTFSHKIHFPAEYTKSITVTITHDRSCTQKIAPCFKKTLSFFPMMEYALNDIKERILPSVSTHLFPWLFYDAEKNELRTVNGGAAQNFVGADIKIRIRGTDDRIMEEFHIKVTKPQRDFRLGLGVVARDDTERTSETKQFKAVHAKSIFKAGRKPDIELKEMKYPPDLAHQPTSVMNRT